MPTLFGRTFDRRDLARHVGDFRQLFGVDLYELSDGQERGVRVLRFRTGGGFSFEVIVDRAMDIGSAEFRGVPIGWRSGMGFRSPWLHENDAELGLGWLRSFCGLVNTCGLDHIMGPVEEAADHYAYPYRPRIVHGLHGRVAYTPARLTGYGTCWDGDRCILWAEGEVRQATMFGENLQLTRRIEAEVGGDSLTVKDRVTSFSFRTTPHAMLYHVNVGWPVLTPESRLVAPMVRTRTFIHDPKVTTIGAVEQAPPQSGFVEQVYEHELRAGADGTAFAALVNPGFEFASGEQGLGFVVEYDTRNMPAFYQWQNLQEGDYVIGLEPGSVLAGSREEWKQRGELKLLEHGESVDYMLRLSVVGGKDALATLERRAGA